MSEQVPSRDELRAHLVESFIAGDVATSREDNLVKYGMFAARVPSAMFGLSPQGHWGMAELLLLMSARAGVSPDPAHLHGPDRIDPDLTIAGLDRLAAAVARAARPGARVMVATGHPAGLLPVHLAIAAGLRAAGADLLTPAGGFEYATTTRYGRVTRQIRYINSVATVSTRGELNHTHSPKPMEAMLAALAEAGEPPPDLVVADHGWAGAAGQAGVESVGFADSNDPGLFVGEAEGAVAVVVPLDDNVEPHLYAPLTAYLLAAAGLLHGSAAPS
ncbi:MAG: phosphatase [Spirochaetaceae bacterium]|nr:phosphatase [Spirochaetaceae bacterium]